MKQIARTFAKTFLSLAMAVVGTVLMMHLSPMPMSMVAPEKGKAEAVEVSALDKAMKKCKPLPEGTMPGAVVIDFVKQKPFYSTNHDTVEAGFNYAIDRYMKAKVIRGDAKIEGVNLCK